MSYFLFALLFLGGSLVAGIGFGYFAYLVSGTEIPKEEDMINEINDIELVSSIYYSNGEKIAELNSDLVRTRVTTDHVSPLIKNALISTEDEYFQKHEGVVPKALIRAMVSDVTGFGGQSGGSTITQQLVKQQLLTSEVSFSRKADELLLAMRVEKFLDKDEIMTAYLNVSPFGRNNKGQNIAGIEEAAQGIFGKTSNDVTLPQAAFLAGLPQSPIVYSPYNNLGELKSDVSSGIDRKNIVLANMYREKYIDKQTYDEAINYDLQADFLQPEQTTESNNGYLYYYIEAQAVEVLMEKYYIADKLTKEDVFSQPTMYEKYYQIAERELRRSGYTIETTIDKNIYNAMNNAVYNNGGLLDDGSSYAVQIGSILMENHTGKILGFVGGRDYGSNQNNHAFQTRRSPGSTMKPILAYAPAIDVGLIGSETQLSDYERNYPNSNTPVRNYGATASNSFISTRQALKESANIPVVNLYQDLLQVANPETYFNKMNINLSTQEYYYPSIPLGGTDYGLTVLEQTNAYQTLANNGQYQAGYSISKIIDPNGAAVYEHKDEAVSVFQPTTSSIVTDLMRDVLKSGTGTTARSTLNSYNTQLGAADWVGKTGTSQDNKDFWFTASTPGVTLSSWIGKSENIELPQTWGQNNMRIWAAIANSAYQISPDIFQTNARFELDQNVIQAKVSNLTGSKMGIAYVNNNTYSVPGKEVNAYFALYGPAEPDFRFGIGGTDANYQQFWNKNGKKYTPPSASDNKTDEKTDEKTDGKVDTEDKKPTDNNADDN